MTERSSEGGIQPAHARAGKHREPIGRRPSRHRSASQRARKTDDLDLLIGKRLRERRILLAITQEDLARRIGLSFQQLQKYEVGENRISAARLFKLSEILEVPSSWAGASRDALRRPGSADEVARPASNRHLRTRPARAMRFRSCGRLAGQLARAAVGLAEHGRSPLPGRPDR